MAIGGIATALRFITENFLPILGAGNDYAQREKAAQENRTHNQAGLDTALAAREGVSHTQKMPDGSTRTIQDSPGQPAQIRAIGDREFMDRNKSLRDKQSSIDRAIGDYKGATTGYNSMENRTARAGDPYKKELGALSDEYLGRQSDVAAQRVNATKDMMSFISGQTENMLRTNPALKQIDEDRQYVKDQFGNIKAALETDIPRTRDDLNRALADISFKGEQDILKAGDAPAASYQKTKAMLDQQLMSKQITPAQYQEAVSKAQISKDSAIGDARQAIVASNYNAYAATKVHAEESYMGYKNNIFNTLTNAFATTTSGVTNLDSLSSSMTSEVMRTMSTLGGKALDQVGMANDILAAANKDAFTVKSGGASQVYGDIVKAINTDGAIAGQIADMTIQNANEDLAYNSDTYSRATATALAAVDNDKYWATMQANIHANWDITVPEISDLINNINTNMNNWKAMALADQQAGAQADAAKADVFGSTIKAGASLASPFAAAGLDSKGPLKFLGA